MLVWCHLFGFLLLWLILEGIVFSTWKKLENRLSCLSFEPRHDKTSKVALRRAKTQISLGIRPVWSKSSLSAWRKLGCWATHWAHSEDSDQTGRMPRLIWVFAGRTLILLVLSCRGSFIAGSPIPMTLAWAITMALKYKRKWVNILLHQLDRVKRIWYLAPMRAAKVHVSLRIRAVSPEPSLLAHTSSESRGTVWQKARSLAPLNGWACAVEICHDGMLEDTNSLDGAQLILWYTDLTSQGMVNVQVFLICWWKPTDVNN